MKKLKINHIKLCPVIGLGYWYDDYTGIANGGTHNIVLPFLRIQYGEFWID